ncbi:hypothetical protein CVT26_009333 [Gymnopilus dilepis]|uniref:Uncharacterized protein n=1 Tax=Gymnopilus dilepis TaxID=231916 RepID=A0A409YA55_9AGAR|nr:hypothetical protein CVT26_009333 [Gymnopilus dilepis]
MSRQATAHQDGAQRLCSNELDCEAGSGDELLLNFLSMNGSILGTLLRGHCIFYPHICASVAPTSTGLTQPIQHHPEFSISHIPGFYTSMLRNFNFVSKRRRYTFCIACMHLRFSSETFFAERKSRKSYTIFSGRHVISCYPVFAPSVGSVASRHRRGLLGLSGIFCDGAVVVDVHADVFQELREVSDDWERLC